MLSKTFFLPLNLESTLFYFSKYKILRFKFYNSNEVYILIPVIFQFKKFNNLVTISIDRSKLRPSNYIAFSKLFKKWVSQIRFLKKKYFKTILVRGVGLKISLADDNTNLLQLKLGFSHLIFLTIPKSITILILKKKLIIKGLNSVDVGNFSQKLMSFKKINSFTGKGLWLKNIQKFYCKPVKKR